MALIKCPECGKDISDKSYACIHCGCPVTVTNDTHSKVSTKFVSNTKSKKIITWGVIALCFIAILSLIIGLQNPIEQSKSIEEYLLGKWTAENENGEATITFEVKNDEYAAKWRVYDYRIKEWEEIEFVIKEIDNHIMTILIGDGEIEFVPFAVSKDTLIFANAEYKNGNQNVPIPTNEYSYIKDGVVRPVTYGLYMGMSKKEVEKAIAPLEIEHDDLWSYCELPEDEFENIRLRLEFDDKYGLDQITYEIDEKYYDDKDDFIDYLTEIYGDYEEQNNDDPVSYRYIWKSGNLMIHLFDFPKTNGLSLTYEIDMEWEFEYIRNNKAK